MFLSHNQFENKYVQGTEGSIYTQEHSTTNITAKEKTHSTEQKQGDSSQQKCSTYLARLAFFVLIVDFIMLGKDIRSLKSLLSHMHLNVSIYAFNHKIVLCLYLSILNISWVNFYGYFWCTC